MKRVLIFHGCLANDILIIILGVIVSLVFFPVFIFRPDGSHWTFRMTASNVLNGVEFDRRG